MAWDIDTYIKSFSESVINKIEDTLNKIDNTDFYVNKSQGNGYYPIERYILVGNNYLGCRYKTNYWQVTWLIPQKKIVKHLINNGYIHGEPTNDFDLASYRCREYDWQRKLDNQQFGGYNAINKFRFHFDDFLYDKENITPALLSIKSR